MDLLQRPAPDVHARLRVVSPGDVLRLGEDVGRSGHVHQCRRRVEPDTAAVGSESRERIAERPDLFDIKFLRDELLYYARDENRFLRRRQP